VNLACACRHLEEPVLSTLWETQESPCTLLETLPKNTWNWDNSAQGRPVVCPKSPVGETERSMIIPVQLVGDPSLEAWNRVHRYASWMRQISVDDWGVLGEETFRKLHINIPPGGWFPALQGLSWCIRRSNLPHTSLFFSQNLKRIFISISWSKSKVPESSLPVIASIISALPTSTLQRLSVYIEHKGIPPGYLRDSLSSIVSCFGPSFTEFSSPIPLSDAATTHLIHLPHLHTWHTEHPPPHYSASSLPLVFPPLIQFALGEGVAPGWLSLFKRLGDHVSSAQDTTPLSKMRGSLEFLNIGNFPDPIIDPSFTSVIQSFRNLVHLIVPVECCDDQCVFKLDNDNVAELAMALPRLENLLFGYPCDQNTCATTVACLLPISVLCTWLQSLEIHFNTTNIAGDLESVSEDSRFQELRSLQKCALSCLDVQGIPLTVDESEYETLARGMTVIFPNLGRCDGWDDEFNWQLAEVRELI